MRLFFFFLNYHYWVVKIFSSCCVGSRQTFIVSEICQEWGVCYSFRHGSVLRVGVSRTLTKGSLKIIYLPISWFQISTAELWVRLSELLTETFTGSPPLTDSLTFWKHKYPTQSVILSLQLRKQWSFSKLHNFYLTDSVCLSPCLPPCQAEES